MTLLRTREQEKGATLVEFSLLFGVLVMLALGTFEYGMVFRDWLSVSVATREGGRVAASAADYGSADCVILEATSGALQSLQSGEISEVHIYRSDSSGSYPGANSSFTRRYRPADPTDPDLVACSSSYWQWLHLGGSWDPNDRNNAGPNADWIGVRVEFEHRWMTNFLWWKGTVSYTDDAVFRMEPPAP